MEGKKERRREEGAGRKNKRGKEDREKGRKEEGACTKGEEVWEKRRS